MGFRQALTGSGLASQHCAVYGKAAAAIKKEGIVLIPSFDID
jgi:hypothetical protein